MPCLHDATKAHIKLPIMPGSSSSIVVFLLCLLPAGTRGQSPPGILTTTPATTLTTTPTTSQTTNPTFSSLGSHLLVTSGSCTDPILTRADCVAAAAALGPQD